MNPDDSAVSLKVLSLQVERNRSLQNLDISFEKDITVLAGPNGSGKSTILETIPKMIFGTPGDVKRDDSGVVSYSSDSSSDSSTITYESKRGGDNPIGQNPFVFFGAERSLSGTYSENYFVELTEVRKEPNDFWQLWRALDIEEALEMRRLHDLTYKNPSMEYVRKILSNTDAFFDCDLYSDPQSRQLRFRRGDVVFSWFSLSSGERAIFALVASLAMRKVELERHFASTVSMLVSIDEIELHLHPKWQREIIPTLRQAFPDCQFIITTHSPQVIGSVEARCVRLLSKKPNGDTIAETPHGTKGVDSNFIIEALMGGDERDPDVASSIREVGKLIDEDQLEEAASQLNKLYSMVEDGKAHLEALRFNLNLRRRKDS